MIILFPITFNYPICETIFWYFLHCRELMNLLDTGKNVKIILVVNQTKTETVFKPVKLRFSFKVRLPPSKKNVLFASMIALQKRISFHLKISFRSQDI